MSRLSGLKLITFFYALVTIIFFFSPDILAGQKDAIISLSTNKIVLGRDESIKVTVKFRKTASDFSIMAAYGKIGKIIRNNDGTIETTYYPPKRFYPGVDVIAAGIETEKNSKIKWVCAPVFLTGQGKATIKTEPGAKTFIRIGNDRFGPVTADSRGLAHVDVVVPPFVNVGIDANGHIVDLHLPKSPDVVLFIYKENDLVQRRVKKADVLIVTYSKKGKFVSAKKPPAADALNGNVLNIKMIKHGFYSGTYFFKDSDVDNDVITVTKSNNPTSFKKTLEFKKRDDVADSVEKVLPVTVADDKGTDENKEIDDNKRRSDSLFLSVLGGGSLFFSKTAGWSSAVNTGVFFLLDKKVNPGIGIGGAFLGNIDNSTINDDSIGKIDISDRLFLIPITGLLSLRINISENFRLKSDLHFGTAYTIHSLSQTVESYSTHKSVEKKAIFAGAAAVSTEFLKGPGSIVIEIEYWFFSGKLSNLSDKFSTLNLLLGYRFYFR